VNAHQIVEAVLFASDAPLTADEIARADENLDEDRVEEAIDFLQAEYGDADRSFQIMELAEGYQILTRSEFAPYLERFDNVPRPSRLSGPALETLAIIAYRQPLGRVEIEYIRGVGATGVMRTLQERQLVDVVGRAEGLGRPLLYGTTRHFLEHFGFRSLEDLPRPEELPVILRDRVPLERPDAEEEEDAQEELELQEAEEGTEADSPSSESTEESSTGAEEEGVEEAADAADPPADTYDVADEAVEVHAEKADNAEDAAHAGDETDASAALDEDADEAVNAEESSAGTEPADPDESPPQN